MAEQKYFPTQQNQEKIFLLIRKHWFNYMMFFFVTFLSFLPIIVFAVYVYSNSVTLSSDTIIVMVIIFSAFFLFMMAIQLYGFVDYYLDIYIVTDQRLVDISQLGLFRRRISELQMRQVVDVSAHVDGLFNTLLHFGDVYIQTAGERENFVFQSIPHPYTVAKQIVDLHQKNVQTQTKQPSRDTFSNNSYSEESLERGLMTEQVEDQAKRMIKDRDLAHKPAHGVYVPKTNKSLSGAMTRSKRSKKANLLKHEGELKEGKETKIT